LSFPEILLAVLALVCRGSYTEKNKPVSRSLQIVVLKTYKEKKNPKIFTFVGTKEFIDQN